MTTKPILGTTHHTATQLGDHIMIVLTHADIADLMQEAFDQRDQQARISIKCNGSGKWYSEICQWRPESEYSEERVEIIKNGAKKRAMRNRTA
jgi:hypothetical protein